LDNRPELQKAITHAKRSKAILVVAKLDRLLRSTVVRSMLKTSGVKFIACDNPHANEFTIDIMAAVAENEVRVIGERTKNALAERKAKGTPLGSHHPKCKKNLTPQAAAKGRRIGPQRASEIARELYSDIEGWMVAQREAGKSFQEIANALNDEGHTTRRGKSWNPMQVKRVIDRVE
jgi:DNA invertase Pin-like site-specific DNA recombinase